MARKKQSLRGKKTRARANGGAADEVMPDDMVVDIPQEEPESSDDQTITVDALTGAVTIEQEDGSLLIDPTGQSLWKPDEDGDPSHEDNLALKIDSTEMNRISEDLLMAIDSDKQGRSQWEQMRAKCIELLGLKLEDPKGDVSRSALGMSTSVVRDPTLLQAVNFFRANAYGELCPSSGPVKVVNFAQEEGMAGNDLADALQTDLNYYLTTTASEYYPDMFHMLWWTGLASGTFKKVYKCPLRRRPVSEFVDGEDLIVPSNATDLKNAGRVTHEIQMRRSVLKRMQILGVYQDFPLFDPMPAPINPVDAKKATVEGKDPMPQRIEDMEYTVYECYCELDIKGFEHKEDGEASGLPLPYRVTIDETSRKILEIRRNWDEDDEDHIAQIPFVLFPFSTGLSRIYGSGLGHEMGNVASALTALLRISIDNGILGNYPGLLKAKGTGRDINNEIMVPPGGCVEIDTGGLPIQQFMMPLPYKDVSAAVIQLMEQTRGVAKELAGTSSMPVGEGRQDAPVGTTLALIEQATKPMAATHKMLHAAQSEEFRLLAKLFRDDPEALWRGNRRPALGQDKAVRLAKFKMALDNCDIVPMADPNVPSEMHRKLQAMGILQLSAPGGMPSPLYNQVEVGRYIARTVYRVPDSDFNKFLAPQQPQQAPPLDPLAVAALQLKGRQVAVQEGKLQLDAKNSQEDRLSKEQIESMKIASTHAQDQPTQGDPLAAQALALKHQQVQQAGIKMGLDAHNAQADRLSKETIKSLDIGARIATHPESQPVVNSELSDLSTLITPAKGNAPMSGGGPVMPEESEEARSLKLALELTNILQKTRPSHYTH